MGEAFWPDPKFIRKLHYLLMIGIVDEYKEQVHPGEYRTVTSRPRDRQLLHPDKIHSSLSELIAAYEKQPEIERNHILDFHVRVEAQIELQKLYAHTRPYLPTDYTED